MQECRFAHAHVFPYSARAGTAAAAFAGRCPPTVKKRRLQQLQATIALTAAEEGEAPFAGTQRPVLWEGQGEPVPDSPLLRWTGLADNYLRVHTLAPPGENLRNRITWAAV